MYSRRDKIKLYAIGYGLMEAYREPGKDKNLSLRPMLFLTWKSKLEEYVYIKLCLALVVYLCGVKA